MTAEVTAPSWTRPAAASTGKSIGQVLEEAARRWPGEVALIDGGEPERRWTFQELLLVGREVAERLAADFAPGEHIAVWAPNRPEWILLEYGAALAGLTLVTVNPALKPHEAVYVFSKSDAVAVFVEPEYRGTDLLASIGDVRSKLPLLRTTISFADWNEYLHDGRRSVLPDVEPTDVCQIQFTSGTTGFPKGALLAHRGLTANGLAFASAIGASVGDVWINPMPLFHTAGCGLATLGALQTGGTQVLLPGFDADAVLDAFAIHRGTVMLSVPTMLIRSLDAHDARPRDLSSWRVSALGGAPVPPELVHRAADTAALTVMIGYGQTEASPYLTHTRPEDHGAEAIETVGTALPGVEIQIVDPTTGQPVPTGHIGEVCTRSISVMVGYYGDPDATRETIDPDGWLHTGDLGSLDTDGYLRINGRLKDMIIRGGENVYPREVEDVLFEHHGVADVAVVGIPDAEWGETVAAFVRVAAGYPTDHIIDELTQHTRDRLASFKAPRIWRVVDEFPQTASGKIQKYVLRDTVAAENDTP